LSVAISSVNIISVENPHVAGTIVTDGSTELTVNGGVGNIDDTSEGMVVRAKGEMSEDDVSVTASQVLFSGERPE